MERYVLEALQKAVTAAVTASNIPTLPVKYVGRSQNPPSNHKWLEIVYLPNNVENQYWGDSKTYRGVMRLLLHWPNNDQGAYEPFGSIQSIANYFVKGLKFQDLGENVTVSITEVPNIMSPIEEDAEMLIPLTIRYNFFNS